MALVQLEHHRHWYASVILSSFESPAAHPCTASWPSFFLFLPSAPSVGELMSAHFSILGITCVSSDRLSTRRHHL